MDNKLSTSVFIGLTLLAIGAGVFILMPFLTPVILAAATATIVLPLYRRLLNFFGRGWMASTLAALVTVLVILIVVLVPLFFLVGSVYAEIQNLYSILTDEASRSQVISSITWVWDSLSNLVFGVLPQHSFESINVTEYIKAGLVWMFGNLDTIFSSFATVGVYSVIFLMAVFYFIRDGGDLKNKMLSWSPILNQHNAYITDTFKKAVTSVFAGTLAVALLEGISTGLAFLAFGIPAPALWGTVAAIASVVPGFGTSLVLIPAAAYLIISGHVAYAVGLLIWGYAAVIIIDHTLGPILMNRGIKIHQFIILLSVLGGLVAFGIVGLIIGPIILVFIFTLLEIYKKTFTPKTDNLN